MIGTLPMSARAPLDYRYAFDAAMSIFAGNSAPLVLCNVPELAGEIRQRIPDWAETNTAAAGLWVEPLVGTWRDDIKSLAVGLEAGAPLVIIISRSLAQLLLERRPWRGNPLGFRPGGAFQVRRALHRAGFLMEASYGIHSALAVGLNTSGQVMDYLRRPDLGDRLRFAARPHYCKSGLFSASGTVMLLVARKELVRT